MLHDQTCTNICFKCLEVCFVKFLSQNKVKILLRLKTCQNCLYQKFPYKNKQIYIFVLCFLNFRAAIKILCAVLFDFKILKLFDFKILKLVQWLHNRYNNTCGN